jgi:hypothetical protein
MLVVCGVWSRGFFEKGGHPLNLAPDASGYGLGLELQVSRLPVVRVGQINHFVVSVVVHLVEQNSRNKG